MLKLFYYTDLLSSLKKMIFFDYQINDIVFSSVNHGQHFSYYTVFKDCSVICATHLVIGLDQVKEAWYKDRASRNQN